MKILERLKARNSDAPAERPILIACIGDSVTHGCFELGWDLENGIHFTVEYRPWEGYVSGLQQALLRKWPVAAPTVLNAGINGDGTRGILPRLDRDVLSFNPDLVVVAAALNDCCSIEIDEYGRNLGDILDRILVSGAEAIVLTPNHMCRRFADECLPDTPEMRAFIARFTERMNSGRLSDFVAEARRQAALRSVPVADAYARWDMLEAEGQDTTSLLANGINHPTPELHGIFVEEILKAIES